ncbi:hypothetical protein R3P38DRAFT_3206263 [Favolaschia claudopus]|uniref:Uncharacterized protein n=1 Tax=Favolaschia claudopus TaxID=2862362 RepID=A0AAW0AKI7_9AGAR
MSATSTRSDRSLAGPLLNNNPRPSPTKTSDFSPLSDAINVSVSYVKQRFSSENCSAPDVGFAWCVLATGRHLPALPRSTILLHIKQHRLLFAQHAASAVIHHLGQLFPPSSSATTLFRRGAHRPSRFSRPAKLACTAASVAAALFAALTSSPFQPSRTKRRMRNLKLLGSAERASSAPATEQKRDGTLLSSRRRAQVLLARWTEIHTRARCLALRADNAHASSAAIED